jgi:hypothetical protein
MRAAYAGANTSLNAIPEGGPFTPRAAVSIPIACVTGTAGAGWSATECGTGAI